MTGDCTVSGDEIAKKLAATWKGGAQRLLDQGMPAGDVARSLGAAGLELWTNTEGPKLVAGNLAAMASALSDVAEGRERLSN